jgi:DNA-binding response OmpR family regulator
MLGASDGLSIVESLRAEDNKVPVLVASALNAVGDRIRGLTVGGDDYLTKPFALGELAARVEALLLRREGESWAAAAIMLMFLLALPWTLLAFWNAVIGFVILRCMTIRFPISIPLSARRLPSLRSTRAPQSASASATKMSRVSRSGSQRCKAA